MILSHLLAVVLASSIGVTDWAEVIQKPSDLDTLNLHELYHAHKEDFIDGLYDHLYKLYLNHPSESDLSHLLQFKLRLEQDLSELATVDSLPHAMNAFDQSFSRIMSAGLSEGKYSLQGLKALVNTYDIHFYSDNRQMSEFLGTDYLEPRLRESTDPEGLLINARDLLRVLYRKHPNHIQKLHSQYKEAFWTHVYSKPKNRRTILAQLGSSNTSFQEPRALVITGSSSLDFETSLYFLEKIIETSQDPSEIVSSLRKVSSKYYESFPNYRTAHPLGFKKDGSVSIGVDTLQMSIPQRLWAGVTHDFGSQPVSFGLELTFKAIAIPFKAMSSLATGKFLKPQRTSPRDQYWIVALKGWKKIQNLLSLDQKLGRDLKVPFRDAAKLSESQEFLLKCRGILSRFTD